MARVAIPLGPDFEDSELSVPCERLQAAGHEIFVFGADEGERLKGKNCRIAAITKAAAGNLCVHDFDALLIPGGYSPDHLRTDQDVVRFVREFGASGKPVAAICHGPQLLIEADLVDGRTLTSWPSVRKDLENAGAHWVDQEVVVDDALITSRKPDDLHAFCDAVIEKLNDV